MRRTARQAIAFGVLALFAYSLPASAAGPAPRFKPGQYEQLMLAVDAEGGLTGYFREDQGEGVVKTCAFFLSGKATAGETAVVTWSDRAFPGTLSALAKGVKLKVEKGREHPGCGLVLLPQIEEGIELDRVTSATWSELRTISDTRAKFHSSPDASKALRTFIVRGDVVAVVREKGDWLQVQYQGRKAMTKGWIRADTTAKLVPPKQ